MIRGWRLFFYGIIAAAVLSIGFITTKYIVVERRIKATGGADPAKRQASAVTIMKGAERRVGRRKKVVDFLLKQPQTVRDNLVWSLEQRYAARPDEASLNWLVTLATDCSGDLPTGETDLDSARLALVRIGQPAVAPLTAALAETTQKTLERQAYAHRRAVAARLLGLIGGAASAPTETRRSLVPPLVVALRDEYEMVRQQAAAALARLDLPEADGPLSEYLQPLLGVLEGRYICYLRLDAEGRLNRANPREGLVYGPFEVRVKPHDEATPEDLDRQRDSALDIEKKEAERAAATKKRLEEGRRGQIVKAVKEDFTLAIEKVVVQRQGLQVVDPQGKGFDVVEGEPMEVEVDIFNKGPGDLVSDFYVAVYGASPPPRNHVDKPTEGEYAGERSRDRRALGGVTEVRHVKSMFHANRPDTPEDDTRDVVYLSVRFNGVEADRVEALRQLMYVAHESCINALGVALVSPKPSAYTVRRQAALALQKIVEAPQTSAAGRQQAITLLRDSGLSSLDEVVRCQSAEALRFDTDPASQALSAAALERLLLTDRDATVRLVATRALGALPFDRAKLLPALATADPAVRMAAPVLFSRPEDAPVAQQLLFGNDEAVAREVLRSSSRLLTTADLVAALRLPAARTRTLAARLLSDRRDAAAAPALLAALQDPEGDVRAAAARGLGRLLAAQPTPDPAAVAALVAVVKNEAGDYVGVKAGEQPEDPATAVITDKMSRAAAVEALVGVKSIAKDQDVVAALKDALGDTSPDVLAAVMPAVAAGALGDQTERLIVIVTVPKDPKAPKLPARIREAGVRAMWAAQVNTPEALDALVGLLNDPNDGIKTAAAVALIGLGDQRGDKVLRDQINSKNEDVRRNAAKLLATLPAESVAKLKLKKKDRDGMTILIESLYQRGSLPVHYRFLVQALVFLGEQPQTAQATLAKMKELLADPHPVMRAAALAVLTALDDPAAAEQTMKLLSDPNERTRWQAASSAGALRLAAAAPALAKLAQQPGDPYDLCRRAAADALAQVGGAQ
ncbi:MAG: HEAT repeat domain-containing protein [Fimbriimonadaceae bacterium]|nr:HEAT repeat domain-containing protein [Fimbriimonadaceae bacterium]